MAIDKELFYASHGLKYPVVARQYTDDMQVKEKIYTKDEVVAMLTELRQEIDIMSDTVVEGRTTTITSWKGMRERICKLIQSKIDKLREKEQEQIAKNCESCRYYGSHHEVCNYCCKCSLWTEQKPTTKNDLAGDIMDFPKSFDEFAKDYGFKDKQEVYTNGSELIPVFRVKQWLEHIATTKNDLSSGTRKNSQKLAKDFGESDCISRADAIRVASGYCHPSNVAKELAKLPSVTPQEPRWIPVSEYLPVTNDEVLVTYIVNGNTKKRYVETANCFYGEWSSVNDEYRIPNTKIEIIAWCEMPKPYREVEV